MRVPRVVLSTPSGALSVRVPFARVFQSARLASVVLSSALLVACANAPKVPDAPAVPYEQLLEEGRQAQKAGNNVQALEAWRSAAKQNPSAKEPWLRMAQLHFDSADYGNAITAAQEAMQRDSTDAVANGLLAVSGLRVSSAALARMHTDNLQGSTRNEAETLAKTLRELLGAPVLVPQPATAAAPAPRSTRAAQRPPAAAAAASAAGAAPKAVAAKAQDTAPAAKPAAPAPSRDPFGALR
jgi:tetratricopeptide (TPR) repeat protein